MIFQLVKDWWASYYGAILAAPIIIHLVALAVDIMLVIGVMRESRSLMLPWMILSMIGIIFMGLGALAIILLMAFGTAFGFLVWQSILFVIGILGLRHEDPGYLALNYLVVWTLDVGHRI